MTSSENETDREAWHWALLEQDGPLSSEESRALQSWLTHDPRREGALARARAACLYLARASAPGRARPEFTSNRLMNSTRRRFITSALASAAVIGLGAWIGRGWMEGHRREVGYTSEVGQIRRVLLADGLELMLNTATEVIVRFAGARHEALLTRGEALFTVTSRTAQPFFVVVGDWLVRATDTTFAVRLGPRDRVFAEITVAKGIIEMLAFKSLAQREPLRLAENQEAIVDTTGSVEVRTETERERQRHLAWLTGMIVFEGEPLHAAVAEMNRYSKRQLALADPELAERRVAGIFRVGDIDTFVSQLQVSWGVQSVLRDGVVLLRPESKSP